MEKTELARKRFDAFLKMIYAAGIPLLNPNTSKISYLNSLLTLLLCYGTFAGVVIYIARYEYDLSQGMANALIFIGCVNILTMDIYLRTQRKHLDELLELTSEFTWDKLPCREPTTGNMTMAGMIPWIKKTLCWNFFGIFFLHLVYCTLRLTMGNGRLLTLAVAQPIDLSSDFNYWMVNGLQLYGALLFYCLFYGYLGLFAMLVAIACSQLEKLRLSLQGIEWSKTEGEVHLNSQLSSCLILHQKIIRFLRKMENTMSPVILAHFFVLTFGICFCAFAGVISWNRQGSLVQIIIFFDTLVLQLFIYCWLGSQLTAQTESVKQAVWNMNWIGTPVKFQRNLLFIATFTNYGFQLTAGKVVVVSLNTMLKVSTTTTTSHYCCRSGTSRDRTLGAFLPLLLCAITVASFTTKLCECWTIRKPVELGNSCYITPSCVAFASTDVFTSKSLFRSLTNLKPTLSGYLLQILHQSYTYLMFLISFGDDSHHSMSQQ